MGFLLAWGFGWAVMSTWMAHNENQKLKSNRNRSFEMEFKKEKDLGWVFFFSFFKGIFWFILFAVILVTCTFMIGT